MTYRGAWRSNLPVDIGFDKEHGDLVAADLRLHGEADIVDVYQDLKIIKTRDRNGPKEDEKMDLPTLHQH